MKRVVAKHQKKVRIKANRAKDDKIIRAMQRIIKGGKREN